MVNTANYPEDLCEADHLEAARQFPTLFRRGWCARTRFEVKLTVPASLYFELLTV